MNFLGRLIPLILFFAFAPVIYSIVLLDSNIRMELVPFSIIGLFLLPAIAAFISIIVIAFHPSAYHYNTYFAVSTKKEDPVIHRAIGLMIALLEDLSKGYIAEPTFYSGQLIQMLQYEIQQYQIYIDRGYHFIFRFYNTEGYEAHTIRKISENDIVVEIDGFFDYFFQRGEERHRTPHEYDRSLPLLREPGQVRCRLIRESKDESWKLAGFSENIRGGELGYATK